MIGNSKDQKCLRTMNEIQRDIAIIKEKYPKLKKIELFKKEEKNFKISRIPEEFTHYCDQNQFKVSQIFKNIKKLPLKGYLQLSDEEIKSYFEQFDVDFSGELEQEEMYQMGEFMGIPKPMMKDWICEIDVNGDGNISQEEFLRYLRSTLAGGGLKDKGKDKITIFDKLIMIEEKGDNAGIGINEGGSNSKMKSALGKKKRISILNEPTEYESDVKLDQKKLNKLAIRKEKTQRSTTKTDQSNFYDEERIKLELQLQNVKKESHFSEEPDNKNNYLNFDNDDKDNYLDSRLTEASQNNDQKDQQAFRSKTNQGNQNNYLNINHISNFSRTEPDLDKNNFNYSIKNMRLTTNDWKKFKSKKLTEINSSRLMTTQSSDSSLDTENCNYLNYEKNDYFCQSNQNQFNRKENNSTSYNFNDNIKNTQNKFNNFLSPEKNHSKFKKINEQTQKQKQRLDKRKVGLGNLIGGFEKIEKLQTKLKKDCLKKQFQFSVDFEDLDSLLV